MATDLREIDYLAGYPDFVVRVRASMVKAAESIGQETSDISTEYRRLRRVLSTNVLADRDTYASRFAAACAALSTVTKDTVDADLDTAVASVWDSIAGAGPAPTP